MSGFLSDMLAPQGVQARWIPTPIAAGAPTFDRDGPWVYIARATSLKGGDRFVRLVARAGAEGVVVGDGPELPAWRRAADAVGARVRFTGALQREAVDRILDRAALVALLPRVDVDGTGAEGLGLTLLEARSRGVMPVGCRTGGVPEACALGPVLESPEDPGASVEAIRAALATWSPAMALEGLERHGPGRIAEALLA